MTTVTTAPQVKVNVMTLEQYKAETKQDTEFYLIKDANPEVIDNLVERVGDLEEGKATVDLSNLSSTGEAHFANPALTNSPYTTNRILEIPQDIKLEIDSNGKCWLKAGSKCYKPNGTIINIVNDIAVGRTTTGQEFIGVTGDGSRIGLNVNPSRCYSGTTAPTGFSGYGLWLDTNSMTYKFSLDGGSTWTDVDYSLPIALVTMKNVDGEVASIDQVFNGFGYIGSTVFALPGVKAKVGIGKNQDGTYAAVTSKITQVFVRTYDYSGSAPVNRCYCIGQENQTFMSLDPSLIYFDADKGYNVHSTTARKFVKLFYFTINPSSKIEDFQQYTVDSLVNSNEFYQLKDKAVTTDTTQTISGSKRFTRPSTGFSIELISDTNQQIVPTSDTTNYIGLYRNSTYTKGDGYTSWIQGYRGSNGWTSTGVYARRFLESDSQEIINYARIDITPDGIPVSYTRTPPASVSGEEIVTAEWVNSKIQLVNELPANPVAGVLYCIPEK